MEKPKWFVSGKKKRTALASSSKSAAHCCVPGCNSVSDMSNNINFHKFTCIKSVTTTVVKNGISKRVSLRDAWRHSTGLRRHPPQPAFVCSLHFLPNDYKINKKQGSLKIMELKATAVPSQNLPDNTTKSQINQLDFDPKQKSVVSDQMASQSDLKRKIKTKRVIQPLTCVVPGCPSICDSAESPIYFYNFPEPGLEVFIPDFTPINSMSDIREEWLRQIQLTDVPPKAYICSEHFSPEDFLPDSPDSTKKQWRLKKTALPALNLGVVEVISVKKEEDAPYFESSSTVKMEWEEMNFADVTQAHESHFFTENSRVSECMDHLMPNMCTIKTEDNTGYISIASQVNGKIEDKSCLASKQDWDHREKQMYRRSNRRPCLKKDDNYYYFFEPMNVDKLQRRSDKEEEKNSVSTKSLTVVKQEVESESFSDPVGCASKIPTSLTDTVLGMRSRNRPKHLDCYYFNGNKKNNSMQKTVPIESNCTITAQKLEINNASKLGQFMNKIVSNGAILKSGHKSPKENGRLKRKGNVITNKKPALIVNSEENTVHCGSFAILPPDKLNKCLIVKSEKIIEKRKSKFNKKTCCKKCGVSLSSDVALKQHSVFCVTGIPFQCHNCKEIFPSNKDFILHSTQQQRLCVNTQIQSMVEKGVITDQFLDVDPLSLDNDTALDSNSFDPTPITMIENQTSSRIDKLQVKPKITRKKRDLDFTDKSLVCSYCKLKCSNSLSLQLHLNDCHCNDDNSLWQENVEKVVDTEQPLWFPISGDAFDNMINTSGTVSLS